MTRRLSLITAVGVAALSVSVPTAFGKVHALAEVAPVVTNQGVGSGLNTYAPFDQARPATLSWSPEVAAEVDKAREALASNTNVYLDSHERSLGTQPTPPVNSIYTPFDKVRPATLSVSPEVANQVALARQALTERYLDAHQRSGPVAGSTDVSTINSGREMEWPQVGVGLGIALLLALGLGLTMRAVHIRPFAH
jgi:hypothetical protein